MHALLRLLLSAGIAAGCASVDAPSLPSGRNVPDCRAEIRLAGLSVYVHAEGGVDHVRFGREHTVSFESGYDWLNRIPPNDRPLRSQFPAESDVLPDGTRLTLPATASRDGSRFAAVVRSDPRNGPTTLVVRDRLGLQRLSSLPGFYFSSLAWSPNSELLAVLQRNRDLTSRSFRDVVSPHPVEYNDIVLSVYSPHGDVVCQTLVVAKRRYASNTVEWVEE